MDIVNIGRGIIGIVGLVAIAWAFSTNRKAINWKTVAWGIGLQLGLAILVLNVDFIRIFFDFIASFFVAVLGFTEAGANFVLGDWPNVAQITDGISGQAHIVGYIFAFKVLPTIIFFSALSSVLYYLGILQFIIKGFAWVMSKTMKLTGTESLAAAANIFIGQTEAPLIIKPYLEKMTKSELMCLMTGGMATIAGGVFAAYVGFLGGGNPEMEQIFATHFLLASIISAPAAIVAAKILYPETEKDPEKMENLNIPRDSAGSNILDAISNGTADGIKLAVNVGAMLLVFTAFVAMANSILSNLIGSNISIENGNLNDYIATATDGNFSGFSLEYILGLLFAPIAWLIGIDNADLLQSGQLLGMKTTLNEFFAYAQLETIKSAMSEKSVLIMTYALCGFANFASIGIQIGGISAIAPGQRKSLTELGILALIGGTIASLLTGAIAGMFF